MRSSRTLELSSALRLQRRRLDAQRAQEGLEPLEPAVELGTSYMNSISVVGSAAFESASDRVTLIDAKFGEIAALTTRFVSEGVSVQRRNLIYLSMPRGWPCLRDEQNLISKRARECLNRPRECSLKR